MSCGECWGVWPAPPASLRIGMGASFCCRPAGVIVKAVSLVSRRPVFEQK